MNPAAGPELTEGQQALWFIQHVEPSTCAYNLTHALSLHFTVDPALLESAARATVLDHALLDRVLPMDPLDGTIRGVRPPHGRSQEPLLELRETDLSGGALTEHLLALTRRPFRLDLERPIRTTLVRCAAGPDVLLVVIHHIASDYISQLITSDGILRHYAALARGAAPESRETGDAFADFARRQREYHNSSRAERAREFWRRELAGMTRHLALPTDLSAPETYRYEGAELNVDLPADLADGLDRAARDRNTTVFVLLITAFQLVLRNCGQDDFAIGYPVSLRRGDHERQGIGYFVNLLPLRVDGARADSFDEELRVVSARVFRGLMHRDFPFALLPWPSALPRDPSRPGPLSVLFVLNEPDPGYRHRLGPIADPQVTEYDLPQQLGQFCLTLQINRQHGHTRASLRYNTSLFTEQRAHELANEYVMVLREHTTTADLRR